MVMVILLFASLLKLISSSYAQASLELGVAAYQIGAKSVAGPTPKCPTAALSVIHVFEVPPVNAVTIAVGISNATNTVIFLLMVLMLPPVPIAFTTIVNSFVPGVV